MKSYHRITVLAVSAFTGLVAQPACASLPSAANPHDNSATDNDAPILHLSSTFNHFPISDKTARLLQKSNYRPVNLAMSTHMGDTAEAGPTISAASSAGSSLSGLQAAGASATESKALLERYHKGEYAEVSKEGLVLLEKEPHNAELRLAVANSLAWSGSTNAAARQYEALAGTPFHNQALLGLANVHRWSGRPDRAAPAYQQVLQKDPDNSDARSGLVLADRELRPLTAARIGRASNSDESDRTSFTASHAWRGKNRATRHEIRVEHVDEKGPRVDLIQRDLSWRYDNLDELLAQVELSVQESPSTKLFGSITLAPANTPFKIYVGHLNWGKLAFNPQALQDGLTANRVGGDVSYRHQLGNVWAAYSTYRISDGNLVHNANAQITPAMQPFASPHIRGFFGVEARKSRFNDSRYWSPEEGQYTASVGVNADWSNENWQTTGSVQYGVPLTGESGHTWSASFGLKRWLSKDWAVAADVWAVDTPRDNGYRAHSASLRIEKLW